MDIESVSRAEADLDRFIERRAKEAKKWEAERDTEAMWVESTRRYNALRREQLRWEWIRYYDAIATSLRKRAEEYDEKAAQLLEDGQKETR